MFLLMSGSFVTRSSLPVVGASPVPYHPALTKRDSMTNEDRKPQWTISRRLLAVALVAILPAAIVAVLATREDGQVTTSISAPTSIVAHPTTTSLDTRTEVIERLVEILKIRDRAFKDRDRGILADIYTADCPCLEGDQNAIQELIDNDYHIVGGATSVRPRRTTRASERLWLIVADFRSAPLRIEAKDGKLVREEPGRKRALPVCLV
jgi:hypothetical protein